MSEKTTFDPIAKTLHWVIAIIVILLLIRGLQMDDLSDAAKQEGLIKHSGNGLLVLVLGLLRLSWRRFHEPPALPASMTRWEGALAKLNTRLLYTLIIYQPTVGLLHAATYVDFDVIPYRLFNLTSLLPSSEIVTRIFHVAHVVGAYLFIAVIALHVLAGFKHLFLSKDRVFQRMFPFMKG
jgi:cytochrome b561